MNFVNDSLQDIETAILRKKVGCVGSQPLPDQFHWCFGSYATRDLGITGHFEASDWIVPARRVLDDADWKELRAMVGELSGFIANQGHGTKHQVH